MESGAGKESGNQGGSTVVVQREQKQTWWTSLTPEQRKVITNIAIALGVSLIAAFTIYFGIRIVRKQIANVEENKSLGKDQHATWAKQIKNAFDNNGWWGTDEALLRNTIKEIPSQEDFEKVQASYRKLYEGANLVETMTGELKQTEYNEMLAIIEGKPEKAKDAKKGVVIYDPDVWAKRFNAAVNYQWLGVFWGTDTEAITAVVNELPSQQAFVETAAAYRKLYGVSLMDDLTGDISPTEIANYKATVLRKPVR